MSVCRHELGGSTPTPHPDNSNPAYRPISCQVTMLRLGRHTERRSDDLKAIPISLIYRHLHFINNLGSPLSVINCIRHVVVCDRQRSKSEDNQRDVTRLVGVYTHYTYTVSQ